MKTPSLSVRLKIWITTVLDFLWVLSGRIFGARIFGGKKVYQVSDFDEIIINRADRLGDAIISRPFLALFARYIRQNYPAMPKIKVIASGYNLEFLTSLASDDIMVEAAPGVTTYDYDRSVWYALKKLALGFIMGFSRFGKTKNRIAFVDLVDSVTEWSAANFPEKDESVWISSNRGPYSLFFDFTAKNRFSGSTKQNLIETYIDLFSAAFSMNGLREYVYENMTEFYLDLSNEYEGVGTTGSTEMVVEKNDRNSALGTGANAKPILCLVGVKEFRNFSSTLWHRIIVAFAEKYPDREVEVIDAPDNLVRESLETFTYPKNVVFIENPHPKSLSNFANWASCRYQIAFWVDGGGINALRPYMDVCVAYTLGNFRVWSAFSGKEEVESFSLGGGEWHINSVQVTPSNRQSWISKHSSYLPSFQIPIGKECFDDLDANSLVDFLGKSW